MKHRYFIPSARAARLKAASCAFCSASNPGWLLGPDDSDGLGPGFGHLLSEGEMLCSAGADPASYDFEVSNPFLDSSRPLKQLGLLESLSQSRHSPLLPPHIAKDFPEAELCDNARSQA